MLTHAEHDIILSMLEEYGILMNDLGRMTLQAEQDTVSVRDFGTALGNSQRMKKNIEDRLRDMMSFEPDTVVVSRELFETLKANQCDTRTINDICRNPSRIGEG